ncbi:MAG TPA: NAD(P)-dependent oxidoreductase, partial [Allocoleopsis sp.]
MRIFLTGATGFIGSRIAKQILDSTSHELLVLVIERENIDDFSFLKNERVSIIRGNLTNIDEWGKKLIDWKPDVTLNLAWEGIPSHDHEQSIRNYNMTMSLYKLIPLTTCKKVIGAGSCWEYGQNLGELS